MACRHFPALFLDHERVAAAGQHPSQEWARSPQIRMIYIKRHHAGCSACHRKIHRIHESVMF
jgi:hypothetical protein